MTIQKDKYSHLLKMSTETEIEWKFYVKDYFMFYGINNEQLNYVASNKFITTFTFWSSVIVFHY